MHTHTNLINIYVNEIINGESNCKTIMIIINANKIVWERSLNNRKRAKENTHIHITKRISRVACFTLIV
jgi:hypothetical protein